MAEKLNLTELLSNYIVSDQAARLPQPIAERAKIHILDTIGAMISGSTLRPGKVAIDFVRSQGGPRDATVVATNLRSSPIFAALANAMTAHADETDDAHFPTVTHPGSVILPTALAVAETRHRSGRDFIVAVVLGYDIMCRINKAVDRAWMGKKYPAGQPMQATLEGYFTLVKEHLPVHARRSHARRENRLSELPRF
jgi:2-methylcitrate dehydratase PrpD